MSEALLSIEAAAKALSIGKTKLYSELADKKLEGVKIGRRTLIPATSIQKYISNLEAYSIGNEVES